MLKIVKMIASLVLIICIFLPLSQCSRPPTVKDVNQTVKDYPNYVWINPEKTMGPNSVPIGNKGYIPAIIFMLPLIVTLLNIRIPREKLRYELLDVLLAVFIIAYTYMRGFASEYLLGSYIVFSVTTAYLLASLVESFKTLQSYLRKREDQKPPKGN